MKTKDKEREKIFNMLVMAGIKIGSGVICYTIGKEKLIMIWCMAMILWHQKALDERRKSYECEYYEYY